MRKYISYFTEIIKGRLTNRNIPIFVVICVTNRCNLRCIYCYAEYYDRDHKEFTTEQLLSLIDELAEMGTKYVSLNGGEPLLRNDIDILINKIREKNILCHMSTNGLLIKNNISLLKKIDSLAISIDGAKEGNDSNRGYGTYDKIIDAFECLKENNIRFHTSTVLTKNNRNAVDEVIALALKYDFKPQFIFLRKNSSPDKKIGLNDNEIREIIKKILDYKSRGFPVFFSASTYNNFLNWPYSYEKDTISGEIPRNYRPPRCYMKRFYCHIEANGLVYPCIVLVDRWKALNFLEVGFKKAWENLANNKCKACYDICCNDHNLIFSLKPSCIWNSFKIISERFLYR